MTIDASAQPAAERRPGIGAEFLVGLGLLGRGVAICFRRPGLFLLGLLPAIITGSLFAAAAVALFYYGWDLAKLVTWFAAGWPGGLRTTVRVLAEVALLGVAALLGVLGFTAVTLAIGDPFYEKISQFVEDEHGGVPDQVDVPWWRSLARGAADSLRLVLASALIGIPLFAAGFIPVVGQTVVPVLGALVAGWFLALELVGAPFERRGLRYADRRLRLRAHRPLAVGFGAGVFAISLVPFGAILIMPGAVAGAALLARRVVNEPPSR